MRTLIMGFCLACWMALVAGCNTMEGMGRDIQGGGTALEGAAENTKHKL